MQVKGGSQGTSTNNYKNISDVRVERHIFFVSFKDLSCISA